MTTPSSSPSREASREKRIYLHSLKEDGLEELFLDRKAGRASQKNSSPKSSASGSAREALLELRAQALKCTRCTELAESRKNVVFGAGNINAKLMFVGEAPGRDEDMQGLPFVGRAGQLLTKIIESIGLTRRQVFIANVLKCRPPGNRTPLPAEVLNCEPYLQRQIELIRPQILCALGAVAAQALLKTGASISSLRGRFHDYHGVQLICTYHPAYLLRNPGEKRKVWEDMKTIKNFSRKGRTISRGPAF